MGAQTPHTAVSGSTLYTCVVRGKRFTVKENSHKKLLTQLMLKFYTKIRMLHYDSKSNKCVCIYMSFLIYSYIHIMRCNEDTIHRPIGHTNPLDKSYKLSYLQIFKTEGSSPLFVCVKFKINNFRELLLSTLKKKDIHKLHRISCLETVKVELQLSYIRQNPCSTCAGKEKQRKLQHYKDNLHKRQDSWNDVSQLPLLLAVQQNFSCNEI